MAAGDRQQQHGRQAQRPVVLPALEVGQVPPQAPELEQAVLGSLLQQAKSFVHIGDFLFPEHFYVNANRIIYECIRDMNAAGQHTDILTVTQALKLRSKLDDAGGPFYISQLTSKVVSSSAIEHHSRIVVQKYMLREMIRVGAEMMREAYRDTTDVFELLDRANTGLGGLNTITNTPDPITMAQVVTDIVEDRNKPLYISMGLGEIDQCVAMGPGDVIVIGARPAVGKTAVALTICRNVATAGHKVYVLTLEMRDRQLGARVAAGISGVDSNRITMLDLDDAARDTIAAAAAREGVWMGKILLDDRSSLRAQEVHGVISRAKHKYNCEVVIVDYLQLMEGDGENGHARMSDISKKLKQAAKANGIRLIELSQLKRRDGAETDPEISDLRESGQIEADGDRIILLARAYNDPEKAQELKLKLVKNKFGPTGSFTVPYHLSSQTIGSHVGAIAGQASPPPFQVNHPALTGGAPAPLDEDDMPF